MILKKAVYKKTKPTRKPGLTEKMKKARLKFCLQYIDKPDEWWHSLVWTDETSIILGHRRGGYRVWRKSNKRVTKSYIRLRWKGYSEFMFWGSFTYHEKGPCHIYPRETIVMKKKGLEDVARLNNIMEPVKKEEWELAEEERIKRQKQKMVEKERWLQEMINQESQVNLTKQVKRAKRQEFLAQERLKDKEKERREREIERESIKQARLRELERLRE